MDEHVVVGDAGHKGLGVFAARAFRVGELILQRRGRIVHRDELAALTPWERLHLDEVTDETYRVLEPPGCYFNHSCVPNAIHPGDLVYAWRDIAAGEEITLDYRLNAYDDGDVWELVCRCEASTTPHVVRGDFFTLPDDLQELYAPWAPLFIQQEWQRRFWTPLLPPGLGEEGAGG